MKPKTLEELRSSHREFISDLRRRLEALGKGDEISPEWASGQKQAALRRFERRLATAKESKKRAVARLDRDIARFEGLISGLKKEIDTEREQIAKADARQEPTGAGKPKQAERVKKKVATKARKGAPPAKKKAASAEKPAAGKKVKTPAKKPRSPRKSGPAKTTGRGRKGRSKG